MYQYFENKFTNYLHGYLYVYERIQNFQLFKGQRTLMKNADIINSKQRLIATTEAKVKSDKLTQIRKRKFQDHMAIN